MQFLLIFSHFWDSKNHLVLYLHFLRFRKLWKNFKTPSRRQEQLPEHLEAFQKFWDFDPTSPIRHLLQLLILQKIPTNLEMFKFSIFTPLFWYLSSTYHPCASENFEKIVKVSKSRKNNMKNTFRPRPHEENEETYSKSSF